MVLRGRMITGADAYKHRYLVSPCDGCYVVGPHSPHPPLETYYPSFWECCWKTALTGGAAPGLVLAEDSCFPQGHTSFLAWPPSNDRSKWEYKGPALSTHLESSEGSPCFQNSLPVQGRHSIETAPRLDFSFCPALLLPIPQVNPRNTP